MKKTRMDSVLEVWSSEYINQERVRLPEDHGAEIVQIEPGSSDGDYIVEVLRREKH